MSLAEDITLPRLFARFAACLSLLLIPALAKAQVNGAGPSDPALFDTVINLPPDPNIGTSESIGGITGQTNQLNVMDDGMVGIDFAVNSGSEVNISGGAVGVNFEAFSGSEVNISGGTVGSSFRAYQGSEVNISGGTVGDFFNAISGSEVNISGGTMGDSFRVSRHSVVNLRGTEFLLDGVLMGSLSLGEAFTISERDVTLSGLLADGTPFDFDLDTILNTGRDYFQSGSILMVTLVPEPGSLLLGALASAGVLRRRRS